ncbi:hypothetical protein EII22_05120 [Coriobacteriales bacterium OH1046]|nr:hypothetical protein EII22_05120 [Coriobacteriales bacterium OH1046]
MPIQVGSQRALLVRRRRHGPSAEIRVDALKAGHHGSIAGTSAQLVDRLDPPVAATSYGAGNPYGLPDEEVLAAHAPAESHGTSADGAMTMTLDGTALKVAAEPGSRSEGGAPP